MWRKVIFNFHERIFINRFLAAPAKEKFLFHNELSHKLPEISNLETLIAFIDKNFKSNIHIEKDLMQRILNHSKFIIRNPENISCIKGLLITLALNRIEDRELFKIAFEQTIKNYQTLEEDHLITILETIIYNKFDFKYQLSKNEINLLFEHLATLQQNHEAEPYNTQLQINIPKLIQLCGTSLYETKKLIHEMQSNIYGILYNLREVPQSGEQCGYLLNMCVIMNALDQIPKIMDQKRQADKLKEMLQELILESFNDQNMLKIHFNEQYIEAILSYTKKYQAAPPQYLPAQILQLIGNVYFSLQHDFNDQKIKDKILKNLQDYNALAYFLIKTNSHFTLNDSDFKVILGLSNKENNLYNLCKSIEIIATQNTSQRSKIRDQCIQSIEQKCKVLMNGHLNPSVPLVMLFQSLVRIEDYESDLDYLLQYFSYGNVIQHLKWQDLLIKFIPSVAVFTKRFSRKFFTEANKIPKEITEIWKKIVSTVEKKLHQIDKDKIPILLFHLSSASALNVHLNSLFDHLKEIPKNNIAEFYYAHSRVGTQDRDLFRQLSKLLASQTLTMNEMNLVLSSMPLNKVLNKSLLHQINRHLPNQFSEAVAQAYVMCMYTLRQPFDERILSIIKNQYKNSKNKEFIIGFASTYLMQVLDTVILDKYIQFISQNESVYNNSPFYVHQLHLLYFKLIFVDKYPKEQLQSMLQVILNSRIALFQYNLYLKEIIKSGFEKEKVAEIQARGEQFPKTLNYYFVDDIVKDQSMTVEEVLPFQIDYRIGDKLYEINGPIHYVQDEQNEYLDGQSTMKKQILENIGFEVEIVKYIK